MGKTDGNKNGAFEANDKKNRSIINNVRPSTKINVLPAVKTVKARLKRKFPQTQNVWQSLKGNE